MVPATLRRLGTLGLIALWVLVSGGLLLLLALVGPELGPVQQAAGVDPADQRHRGGHRQRAAGAQDHRAGARVPGAGAGLAPDGAHRGDLRLPGDRTAHHRLSILPRVPESRHRQLVQGGDQAGPDRRPRAVEGRDGRAHARICAQHGIVRRQTRGKPEHQLGAGHRRAARPKAARSRSWCTTPSARCWRRAAPDPPRPRCRITRLPR